MSVRSRKARRRDRRIEKAHLRAAWAEWRAQGFVVEPHVPLCWPVYPQTREAHERTQQLLVDLNGWFRDHYGPALATLTYGDAR